MFGTLRDGTWVTPDRLRAYPALILALSLVGVAALIGTSHQLMDWTGRPLGTDFSQVWAAGVEVLGGRPAAAFDPVAHAAEQRALFGAATPFYGWHYPPYFLAVAAVLALMPYGLALPVWQAATLPLYLAGVGTILRGSALPRRAMWVAAAAFPAVFVNLMHGHNGFLTAGLMTFGLLCLRDRPLAAGVLFGLLAYKPQFGLVLPVALAAAGAWRAIAAGFASLAAITALSVAAFGSATWRAFGDSLAFTRKVVLEQGDTGWEKIQSAFSAARMLGAGVEAAYAVQAVVTLMALALVAWVWRSRADRRLAAALVLVASLLTTPYCLDYDLVMLGPAIAFAVAHGLERGFAPWEKTVLAIAWAMPLFARAGAAATHVPIGFAVLLATFALLARRALAPAVRAAPASLHPALA